MSDDQLSSLWHAYEHLDAGLEALEGEIEDLSPEEVLSLVRLQQRLTTTCACLTRCLEQAALGESTAPRMGGVIDSMDHPVMRRLLKRQIDCEHPAPTHAKLLMPVSSSLRSALTRRSARGRASRAEKHGRSRRGRQASGRTRPTLDRPAPSAAECTHPSLPEGPPRA
jgi:hypothetical protein